MLHLFVDDREIQQVVNVSRVVNRPKRYAEPIVAPDQPWERGCRAWAWGNVIQEPDGLLRMWYMLFNVWHDPGTLENGNFAYAESRDGLHWEKPSLGLYEFNGSRENNIVVSMGSTGTGAPFGLARRGGGLTARDAQGNVLGVINNADGITVVRDDEEPDPAKRYKLIANMQDHRMWAPYYPEMYPDVTDEQVADARRIFGQYMLTSPDGLHWSQEPLYLKGDCHGDYMMVTRDHRNQQWWMNERPSSKTGRTVGLCTSQDLIHWTTPTETIFSNDPESGFGRLWEWHAGITPFNYGNQDLGLLERWSNVGFGEHCELVSHRDGEPWQRVAPDKTFLDVGPEGSFDRCLAYPLHNAPCRIGDKLYIYYSGRGMEPGTGRYNYGAIGLATIGLDRFVGLSHWRRDPGVVMTRPLKPEGDLLQVNVEAFGGPMEPGKGEVRVAVKNPDWSDIPGYTWEDCLPVRGDQVRALVEWQDKKDLSSLRGRTVVLHFQLSSAVLYSYRWASGKE
jgi:hypothetical protein